MHVPINVTLFPSEKVNSMKPKESYNNSQHGALPSKRAKFTKTKAILQLAAAIGITLYLNFVSFMIDI